MFRDNKREIFGFRKYKAYGLASAVIAAFFLIGGVASADEVTKPTTSDVAALAATSPTETPANAVASSEEVAANNAVATPEANTSADATNETPAVASGENASAMDASTTSPYVSDQAKQSVQDNLVPLAKKHNSCTNGGTAL